MLNLWIISSLIQILRTLVILWKISLILLPFYDSFSVQQWTVFLLNFFFIILQFKAVPSFTVWEGVKVGILQVPYFPSRLLFLPCHIKLSCPLKPTSFYSKNFYIFLFSSSTYVPDIFLLSLNIGHLYQCFLPSTNFAHHQGNYVHNPTFIVAVVLELLISR